MNLTDVVVLTTSVFYFVDISKILACLEVSTMGRHVNQDRVNGILNVIRQNDGKIRAAGIAKELGLPKSSVTRILPVIDEQSDVLLTEERGFLGIFKRK